MKGQFCPIAFFSTQAISKQGHLHRSSWHNPVSDSVAESDMRSSYMSVELLEPSSDFYMEAPLLLLRRSFCLIILVVSHLTVIAITV